jgi:hypothetical protein
METEPPTDSRTLIDECSAELLEAYEITEMTAQVQRRT